jgi:hypothetical protein
MNDRARDPSLKLDLAAAQAVLACPEPSLRKLVQAGGLDPQRDFRGVDLRGWPLGGQDVRGFDFSHSDLRGTGIETALSDSTTRFDNALRDLPSSVPLPEDFPKQARDMILAGTVPPALWWPDLKRLSFVKTGLQDLSPLASLTALESLDLRGTPVSDVNPLAGLTALKILHLINAPVSDVSPLASLTALQSLDLRGTLVSDVRPLASLTALQRLYLLGTEVSNVRALTDIAYLRIYVESQAHASALRATLTKGSSVTVVKL